MSRTILLNTILNSRKRLGSPLGLGNLLRFSSSYPKSRF